MQPIRFRSHPSRAAARAPRRSAGRQRAARWLAGLAIASAAPSAPAEVRHTAERTYYDVVGDSAEALRTQIQALRPRGEDGGRYDAYTRWKLEWRYLYREQRDGCRRTSFRTHLTTTIHLPRWQAPPDAAPDLRQRWEAYVAALDRHERHHEALAIEAADALERRVGAIDRAADCKTLEAEVNAAGEAVIEDYRARQRAYDVETGHGRSEGVRFP
jgi:predicted secreted Zn-dependent protease